MSFSTEQIELSMCSPETGLPLTANVYTLEGVNEVDGTPRKMSIGQLVLAICLQRAAALEEQVVQLMDSINQNTMLLNGLTEVETQLVAVGTGGEINMRTTFSYDGANVSYYDFLTMAQYGIGLDFGPNKPEAVWINSENVFVEIKYDDFITAIEAKMDERNSFSQ